MSRLSQLGAVAFGFTVVLPITADAQTRPDPASLVQDRERLLAPPQDRPSPEAVQADVQPTFDETGPHITVTQVTFSGLADLLSKADRDELALSARGQRLGFRGLRALAEDTTRRLQRQGNLLAQAILPPQDVTDGQVEIHISEGVLDEAEIRRGTATRIREDHLRARLDPLLGRPGLRERDVETAILLINDLPGVEARARLGQGRATGTARLTVEVDQAPPAAVVLTLDNFGTPSTGQSQAGTRLSLRDLSGHGEQWDVDLLTSRGTQLGRVALRLPVASPRLRLTLDAAALRYRNIDTAGVAAGLHGSTHDISSGLEYDLQRSRATNLRISLRAGLKAQRDDSAAGRLQDKRTRTLSIRLSGDRRWRARGFSYWDAGVTFGRLDLSRVPGALAVDAATGRTHGSFARLNVTFGHLHPLSRETDLLLVVSGQRGNRNLDSTEKFALGGPFGLRAWPVGEAKGDSGVLATLELRHRPARWQGAGQLELAAFVDAGRIRLNQKPTGLPVTTVSGRNSYGLAGAGLAVRWRSGKLDVQASWARGIGSNPGAALQGGTNADGRTGRDRVWLAGAVRF